MENDDNDNDNDNDDNDDDKQCHSPEASTGAPYSKNQLIWSRNSWVTRGVYLENVNVTTPFLYKTYVITPTASLVEEGQGLLQLQSNE